MLGKMLIIFFSIFQEHAMAISLYLKKISFWEAFVLLEIGAIIAVLAAYYLPEELKLITLPFRFLWHNLKKLIGKNADKISFVVLWKLKYEKWQTELIKKIVKNGYPAIIIFIVCVSSVPGSFPIAIMAARILKLKNGIWLLLAANSIKTIILVFGVYEIGNVFAN